MKFDNFCDKEVGYEKKIEILSKNHHEKNLAIKKNKNGSFVK